MKLRHRFATGLVTLGLATTGGLLVVPAGARAGLAAATPSATTAAFAVRQTWVRVTDRTRSTVSFGHVLARSRTLPTLVLRPAASGRRPLVVFCHGFDTTPRTYLHLLRHWAAAGFVVAAPFFPLTRPSAGRWLDEADVDNQPRDVSAVITAVERRLATWVDPQHVVVAGHSDGGSTAFGVGFANALRDRRVNAVMVFSGARRPTMGRFARRRLPLLLVQSDRDEFNSLHSAAAVWAVPLAPKVYLHLHRARHLPPFSIACPWRPIVEAATTDFLRAWTTTRPSVRRAQLGAMDRDGRHRALSWVSDDR